MEVKMIKRFEGKKMIEYVDRVDDMKENIEIHSYKAILEKEMERNDIIVYHQSSLQIDEQDNRRLYWDGKKVLTKCDSKDVVGVECI